MICLVCLGFDIYLLIIFCLKYFYFYVFDLKYGYDNF